MKTYSRKKPGESTEIILHLDELCRLCMTKEDVLVPIFNDTDTFPLTLRIMSCVQLEVFEGDGLPNKICHPCRFQLEKSYSFRKKCEQSDAKLRHHLKLLQEKMGDQGSVKDDDENEEQDDSVVDRSTEEDLVGVPQLAYIEPTHEIVEEDTPENITLPMETDHLNKEACTLVTRIDMKKEEEERAEEMINDEAEIEDESLIYDGSEETEVVIDDDQEQGTVMDENDLEAIADAVKQTLASHPGINVNGELQMKFDKEPGKPTQVQVTTEDGAVIVMQLSTEDDPDELNIEGLVEDSQDMHTFNEDGEMQVFKCPDCPKSFARRIQLRRHASVHMQQRGFSCGICEKWFPTRSALVRHERIHTGERPFQCEVCQKSFAQKEILFRHLMTHTGQKPYNCPHCPKGFTQKEPLRAHLRTHLNPNPNNIQLHYCTLCPKVFCHASGLSRHLVTHTGKTFKCRDCDKSFTDKSSLRRHHRQTMHQE